MKNVRKDVIVNLLTGLLNARINAEEHGASYPNTYKYSTRRCEHYVTYDKCNNCYHFNSVKYDGTRLHTTLKYEKARLLMKGGVNIESKNRLQSTC